MAPQARHAWCLLTSLAFLGEAPGAEAWGRDGHKITARLAQVLLSPAEMRQVGCILGEGVSLASVANWADEQVQKLLWSQALHFINTPDGRCDFDYGRDCRDNEGAADRCVAGAILNYTEQLMTIQKRETREEALKFLVHFLGDIHQPLHVGWLSDQGGNQIRVEESWEHDQPANLHVVWDSGIIDGIESITSMNEEGIARNLTEELRGDMSNEYKLWSSCLDSEGGAAKVCVERIARESIRDACAYAYRDEMGQEVSEGDDLDQAYFETRAAVVRRRLAAGGVRLAAFLKYVLKASDPEALVI